MRLRQRARARRSPWRACRRRAGSFVPFVLLLLAKLDDLFEHLDIKALALGFREDLFFLLVELLQLGVELLDALHERTDAVARNPNRVGHHDSFLEPSPHHPAQG
jgi:hypothetical protein